MFMLHIFPDHLQLLYIKKQPIYSVKLITSISQKRMCIIRQGKQMRIILSSLSLVPLGPVNILKEDFTRNSGQSPSYELNLIFEIHMHYFCKVIPFVAHTLK